MTELLKKEKKFEWSEACERSFQELKKRLKGFTIYDQDTVWFGSRICIPARNELKDLILREAHESAYFIHPGSTKMYQDIKEYFWWAGMKWDVAEYVALYDICQRVKAEHQRPASLL